ncbi:MAG: molybdopterin molybdotransferase MoeA [Chloroflexota bacterium]|nr:molybdopterin molybdotransferase MoeA [Chloroflexota bacterium]MDE2920100.1 molybdopterin molybdotransferase MoeA [Chloroflexota bacterium]
MTDLQTFLSVDDALERILRGFTPLPARETPLAEALGLVAAEDVLARDNVPGFDNSAYDGYAIQAADLARASADTPARLRVVDEIPAGRVSPLTLQPGEAARIMTGAPIPAGADAVVPFEDTDRTDWGYLGTDPSSNDTDRRVVAVLEQADPGENIRPAGGDISAGSVVVKAGRRLGPAEIGVLGSVGVTTVRAHPRATAAIVPTGDEIVEIDAGIQAGQVRNSNAWALEAATTALGAEPRRLPITGDTIEALQSAMREGSAANVIVTIGGVSMGDYDLVTNVLGSEGRMDFWQINMRPGKPLAFGTVHGTPVIGLPGNPVSSMVCFTLFVRPALLRLMGHRDLTHPRVRAIAGQRLGSAQGKRTFLRVQVRRTNGQLVCTSAGDQSSYRMSSLVAGNGLAVLREDQTIEPGEPVDILALDPQALLQL